MSWLILLRHGESTFNRDGRFTGWHDDDLTPLGEEQARRAGRIIGSTGLEPIEALVSPLRRAGRTLQLVRGETAGFPVRAAWRLAERHVGALEGMEKSQANARYGAEAIMAWRQGLDVPPPRLGQDDPRHPRHKEPFRRLPPDELPLGESMAMVMTRIEPVWRREIRPLLGDGRGVLAVAHGGSLWALLRLIAGPGLRFFAMPNANPLLVELDDRLQPRKLAYLDEDRAGPLPAP